MAAPAPGCDTLGSRDTALAPPGTAGTSGAGVALGVPGGAAGSGQTLPVMPAGIALPAAASPRRYRFLGSQVSVHPQTGCHRPWPPQTLPPHSCATPAPATLLLRHPSSCHPTPCHPAPVPPQTQPPCSCAKPAPATLLLCHPAPVPPQLLCHPRPCHPGSLPFLCHHNLSPLPAHSAPQTWPGLLPTSLSLTVTGHLDTVVPGHPRGTQAEGRVLCCAGGSLVAPLRWQPPGQGRKRPRSRCAVKACGFLAAVSAWPGAASHARPRTGCPPTTTGALAPPAWLRGCAGSPGRAA